MRHECHVCDSDCYCKGYRYDSDLGEWVGCRHHLECQPGPRIHSLSEKSCLVQTPAKAAGFRIGAGGKVLCYTLPGRRRAVALPEGRWQIRGELAAVLESLKKSHLVTALFADFQHLVLADIIEKIHHLSDQHHIRGGVVVVEQEHWWNRSRQLAWNGASLYMVEEKNAVLDWHPMNTQQAEWDLKLNRYHYHEWAFSPEREKYYYRREDAQRILDWCRQKYHNSGVVHHHLTCLGSFHCEHCGAFIIDSPAGYVTGCVHYPKESMNTIHTLNDHLLAIQVPRYGYDWDVQGQKFTYMIEGEKHDQVHQVELPPGNWKVISGLNDLLEELSIEGAIEVLQAVAAHPQRGEMDERPEHWMILGTREWYKS